MVVQMKGTDGFALDEILLVTLLLSVVFLAGATAYVSSAKFFSGMRNNQGRVDTVIAMEHIARKLNLANQAVVDQSNQQIRMRWDYQLGTLSPNNTPNNPADDTWVKYRIISGRLYWRNDAAELPEVSNTDNEVASGLILLGGSSFTLVNPTATTLGTTDPALVGDDTVVNIQLVTQSGTPPKTQTLKTSAAVGAVAKN